MEFVNGGVKRWGRTEEALLFQFQNSTHDFGKTSMREKLLIFFFLLQHVN
jgi:hypothetical protein